MISVLVSRVLPFPVFELCVEVLFCMSDYMAVWMGHAGRPLLEPGGGGRPRCSVLLQHPTGQLLIIDTYLIGAGLDYIDVTVT